MQVNSVVFESSLLTTTNYYFVFLYVQKFHMLGDDPKSEIMKKVKRYCRERMAPYKVTVKIEFADSTFENHRFKKQRTILKKNK